MRKLTVAEACFELCKGAHICVAHLTNFKRPYISLSNPNSISYNPIGYITEKQFEEIDNSCSIKFNSDRKDKYGNIYNYYVIEDFTLSEARKEFLKRKKERLNVLRSKR